MSIAQDLARIERLSLRDLPTEPPHRGWHIAELRTSEDFQQDGGAAREEVREQYEAERDALTERLTARWGPPRVFGLGTALLRAAQYGEHIPEPWRSLSAHVPDVHAWRRGGRWTALGISQQDEDQPCQLLAVVTTADPP